MAKSKYTVDWFIKFFSAIPASKWMTGWYSDGRYRRCAVGHLLHKLGRHGDVAYVSFCNLFPDYSITGVNDGRNPSFQQKTPRARVLAALRAIKNKVL